MVHEMRSIVIIMELFYHHSMQKRHYLLHSFFMMFVLFVKTSSQNLKNKTQFANSIKKMRFQFVDFLPKLCHFGNYPGGNRCAVYSQNNKFTNSIISQVGYGLENIED
jgi:hypothetical protein